VYQKESVIGAFEEQVTNPEIQISIDKNPFIIVGKIFKHHPKRNIYQNVTYSATVPEKITIITIIPVVVVNINLWFVNKFTDYMPVIIVMIIIPVIAVCVWIVVSVIISPAIVVPPVIFPISVPVVVVVIIISMILFVVFTISAIFR
jgi:hypothetical protein